MKITREIVRHPNASLRFMRFELPTLRANLHRHQHVELTFVERGSGLRWVGEVVEPYRDGDVVLLGANLPHTWVSPGGQHGSATCAATVVQFPADWPALAALPELQGLNGLLARATQGICLAGNTRRHTQQLMRRMADATAAARVGLLIEILALLEQRLRDHLRDLRLLSQRAAVTDADSTDAAARSRRLYRLHQWIQSHLAEPLHVADAAALVGVSPAAFARFFRREVGKPFVDYVNDARCSWAALRLHQGDEAVAVIAHDCGFATLSNFGQQFRRRYGVSPRAYRQRAAGRRTDEKKPG